MYRIFCESYNSIINDFQPSEYRYIIIKPFELLTNQKKYFHEKQENTDTYKKISDFLWYAQNSISKYPRFSVFLWTIESRDMRGEYFGLVNENDLEEQAKILNMILKLAYWE